MNNWITVVYLIFYVSTLVHGGAQETSAQGAATATAITGPVTGASAGVSGSDSADSNSSSGSDGAAAPPSEQPVSNETCCHDAPAFTGDIQTNDLVNATEVAPAGGEQGEPVTQSSQDSEETSSEADVEQSSNTSTIYNSEVSRVKNSSGENESKRKETTTSVYEEMIEEETTPTCFNTTEIWQSDILRRVIVVEDNVRFQIATLLGPATANRRALLRRALYHLMLLEKIVTQVSLASEDESGTSDTLYRSERNLNRIGWIVYRGRNGWHFYDCCYQSLETEDPIETMCGQRGEIDRVNRI